MYEVFVYCGGKCGSVTLENSFKKNGYNTKRVHNNIEYQIIMNNSEKTIFNIIDESSKNYENIYIIDSYRTPIERKISSFFQNIDNIYQNIDYNQICHL